MRESVCSSYLSIQPIVLCSYYLSFPLCFALRVREVRERGTCRVKRAVKTTKKTKSRRREVEAFVASVEDQKKTSLSPFSSFSLEREGLVIFSHTRLRVEL